jgi:chaperonin cofactor prefoldin
VKVIEQQALLETLTKKKTDLDARIARLEARKEADTRQWAQKSAELKATFGTDDLTEIKAILEKEKAENEAKLLACQAQLDAVAAQVEEMESTLASMDAA